MKKSFLLPAIALIAVSCSKPADNFIWERTFGEGAAYFIKTTPDSGIVSGGKTNGSPYLIKLRKDKSTAFEFRSSRNGLFSSVWFNTSFYVAGGSSNGMMLLACFGKDGTMIWDTLLAAGFKIRTTGLVFSGNGNIAAVGSAMPDSVETGSSGILFVRFDTAGNIMQKKETTEANFAAAGKITDDLSGNILIPLTRKKPYSKAQASVAKYSYEFNKLWETDLYNNTDFGAASRGIISDAQGNVYVAGNTELASGESVLNTSFLVSLSPSGSLRWKKYLEKTNSGTALIFDENGSLMMLNANCFIVNLADPADGSDEGIIRMFDVCNSKETDVSGNDLDLFYDGNILVAGSKGGTYYLALKSFQQ